MTIARIPTDGAAAPFVSTSNVPDSQALRVLFRAEEPGDRNYILGCWSRAWGRSLDCRWMSPDPFRLSGKFHHYFQGLVVLRGGLLTQADTQILIGCSPEDRSWVWCFCVFTPGHGGTPPVIHWTSVRPTLRDDRRGRRSLLRIGLATRMLGIGRGDGKGPDGPGVTDRLTYTCRPGPMTSFPQTQGEVDAEQADLIEQDELRRLEGGLHDGLRKVGVAASYSPLHRWLRGGG